MATSPIRVDETSPPSGRALLRALWRGGPGLPTTIAGAEMCILVAFIGLRATDIVQLLVSAPVGLDRSTRSPLDLALIIGYLAESGVVITLVVRARRYLDARLATVDTAFALLVLLCEPLFTSSGDRVGTWTA